MNTSDADAPSQESGDAVGEATAKSRPARKRAPRKVAPVALGMDVPAVDGSPAAGVDAVVASDTPADPSEPVRRPRKRPARAVAAQADAAVVATSGDTNADVAEVSVQLPGSASSEEPVRRARRDSAAADDAPAGDSAASAEPAADRQASEAGEPSESGEGGERPRSASRSRNRRRGRRGAEKRAAALAAAGGADEFAVSAGGQAPDADSAGLPALLTLPPAEVGDVFAEVMAGLFDTDTDTDTDTDADTDAGPVSQAGSKGEAGTFLEASGASVAASFTTPSAAETAAETAAFPAASPAAPRRVLAPEPDAPKLHKVLAQSGVGSRRDLEQMIADGRVTVNGEVAHTGQRISFGDRIAIDAKPVRVRIAPPPARVLAYHKPAGEVVTHDDPQQRPTVFRRLPRLQQGKWQSVGRLDINTEGLLLFTNSGELANQLMHPRFGVEREYAVRSLGVLASDAKERLIAGVQIDGQPCAFKSIEDGGGEGVNHWYRCVITEGRNREVRKLFEAVGHAVSRLIRIRYGTVVLPRGLKRGVWVDLAEDDLRTLRRLAIPAQVPRPERVPDESAEGRGRRNRRGGRKRGADALVPSAEAAVERVPQDRAPREERQPRPPRAERPARPDGGRRGGKGERGVAREFGGRNTDPDFMNASDSADSEVADGRAIPNPLQQTFDRRAIQKELASRRELSDDSPIPNPLQQTYDQRALQRERMPQRDIPEDGPIPNPLQQTYDKRFATGGGARGNSGNGGNGGNGRKGGNAGFGGQPKPAGAGPGQGGQRGGGKARGGAAKKAGGGTREPDPMQTSVGYIGGDAFQRKGGGGGGGRGGPRSGGRGRGGPTGGQQGGPQGGQGGQGGGNRGGRGR